jgi:hypothetical protein
MRRLLLHLSTALVAFVLGVTTAIVFGVFNFQGPRAERRFVPAARFEPAPRACPNSPKFFQEMPPPPLPPAPPLAPLPPEPLQKGTRVVIRRSDGSVKVIETEKRVEGNSKGS